MKEFKVSKYTIPFTFEEDYYVYNTLSNALIKIDKDCYELISKSKISNEIITEDSLDQESFNILSARNIFTENDDDDFLLHQVYLIESPFFV